MISLPFNYFALFSALPFFSIFVLLSTFKFLPVALFLSYSRWSLFISILLAPYCIPSICLSAPFFPPLSLSGIRCFPLALCPPFPLSLFPSLYINPLSLPPSLSFPRIFLSTVALPLSVHSLSPLLSSNRSLCFPIMIPSLPLYHPSPFFLSAASSLRPP